jgi:hypothetical protein
MKYWVAGAILLASYLVHYAWAIDQVTNLTATSGSSQITLQWNVTPGAVGYVVLRNSSQIALVSGTSYVDNGLTTNVTYNYSVGALLMTGGQLAFVSATTGGTTPPPVGSGAPIPIPPWVSN